MRKVPRANHRIFPPIMAFDDDFIRRVRERASIARYAGRKLAFDQRKSQPQKGDYWACCPFHGEKTASFHVLDKRGLFHCFGCGEKGDVFRLAMKLEGLSFPEAVERLANEAGVPLPTASPQEKEQAERRKRGQSALARAAALFEQALRAPEGRAARAYLEKRGLGPEQWQAFAIGWAPAGWTTVLDRLRADGFSLDELRAAGLVREKDGRPPSDFFHARVMFPIHDAQGRLIAFGGRLIEPGEPKYLNSPETPLFSKGRALYRLHAARELAAKTKARGLVVAEGYLDAIAFERAGVAAVAPLGTAITDDQLQLIWRSGPEPILCFDGDDAGRRAAQKALELALPHLSPAQTVRIALLPQGADPDDLFRAGGADALTAALAGAAPAVEALFERARSAAPLETPEAKAGFKERLRAAAARIGHEETRRQYLRDLLARADAALGARRPFEQAKPAARAQSRAAGARRAAPPPSATPELKAAMGARRNGEAEGVLQLAVDTPGLLDRGAEALADYHIADEDLRAIRDAILDLHAAGETVDRGRLNSHLHKSGDVRAAQRVERWPQANRPIDENDPQNQAAERQWMALVSLNLISVGVSAEVSATRARGAQDIASEELARRQAEMAARREQAAAALRFGDDPPPER